MQFLNFALHYIILRNAPLRYEIADEVKCEAKQHSYYPNVIIFRTSMIVFCQTITDVLYWTRILYQILKYYIVIYYLMITIYFPGSKRTNSSYSMIGASVTASHKDGFVVVSIRRVIQLHQVCHDTVQAISCDCIRHIMPFYQVCHVIISNASCNYIV